MPLGGVISTGSNPKLLWPGIRDIWGMRYNEHAVEYPDLYEVLDSEQNYEQDVQITPFGIAPIKPEGQDGSFDSQIQGGVTTYQHIPYFLGYIVTFEEQRDNLYRKVSEDRASANAFSISQTTEVVGAFLYNNAFSTTYFTTWDALALGSAAHLNATGGTWSNILSPAADLAEASLEDACVQIMGYQDDRGNFISVMPMSLHVSRQEWFNSNRILKSVLQPDSTSNNLNVLKATNAFPGGIKLNHYFTVAHPWFIRTNAPKGMRFFWRDKPMFDLDNDFTSKNLLQGTYMRFSVGCTDPRGWFGSNAP